MESTGSFGRLRVLPTDPEPHSPESLTVQKQLGFGRLILKNNVDNLKSLFQNVKHTAKLVFKRSALPLWVDLIELTP